LALIIQICLHDTLHDFTRTLEIANEEVSEVVEIWGAWDSHACNAGLDVENEKIKENE